MEETLSCTVDNCIYVNRSIHRQVTQTSLPAQGVGYGNETCDHKNLTYQKESETCRTSLVRTKR